jgi:hypothetical protein
LSAALLPAAGGAETIPGTLSVEGVGHAEAEPDLLLVDVGVAVVSESALEASREARRRMNAIYDALGEIGIGRENIETTNVSIHTEYTPQGPGQEEPPTRYRAQNMVRVRSEETDQAGPLIDALIQSGANQLMGVRFGVSDESPYLEEARRGAVRDARRKAELMAQELDLELGGVREISSAGGNGRPVPYEAMALGRGGESTPVSPGSITFTERVSVVFELR